METAFVGGKDLTGKGTFWDNAKVLDLDLGVGHTGVYVCNYYVRFTVLFISIEKTHTYLFLQLHAMGCQWILPALPLDWNEKVQIDAEKAKGFHETSLVPKLQKRQDLPPYSHPDLLWILKMQKIKAMFCGFKRNRVKTVTK